MEREYLDALNQRDFYDAFKGFWYTERRNSWADASQITFFFYELSSMPDRFKYNLRILSMTDAV